MKKSLFYLAAAIIPAAIFGACTAEVTTLPMNVTLSQNTVTLSPGGSLTLTAEVKPDEAAVKTLTWSSSDPAVATVAGGVVTAIAEGMTTITVTTNSGQKTTACIVTVAYPVSGVVLNKSSALLPIGQSLRLTATVMPDDAPDKAIKWESSNPDVATVVNGVVTAKAAGTAIISVITDIGHRIARANVKVPPENYMIISMTLASSGFVSFSISGSGVAEIDWDDITFDTYTLSPYYTIPSHSYNYGLLPRTVTIAGENITRLQCTSSQITSLDVSKCATLTELNCLGNQLTSLKTNNNQALTFLDCSNNQLTSLDMSNNIALRNLYCSYNQLSSLDVSNNIALTELYCYDNQLTVLDVSNNTKLINLYCSNNQLSSLNISNNVALKNLNCATNQLTTLDINKNTALTELNSSNNQLSSLDVSYNPALSVLYCSRNLLTNLNIGPNSKLTKLNCSYNELSDDALNDVFEMLPIASGSASIDFINNPGTATCNASIAENKGWTLPRQMFLTVQGSGMVNIQLGGKGTVEIDWGDGTYMNSDNLLFTYAEFSHIYIGITSCIITITGENVEGMSCRNSRITALDVSKNTALYSLYCDFNQLTNLDVSKNTALTVLDCSYNQITHLDMSNNTNLVSFSCSANQLSTEALNALFRTLHNNFINGGYKWVWIQNNPGAGACDRSIATGKGWIFMN